MLKTMAYILMVMFLGLFSITAFGGTPPTAAPTDGEKMQQYDPSCANNDYSHSCKIAWAALNHEYQKNNSVSQKIQDVLGGVATKIHGGKLIGIVTTVMVTADGMASHFIKYAEGIAGLLAGIAFVWLGIMIMLSQADIWHMGLRPLFSLIFVTGFTYFLLWKYNFFTSSVVDGFIFTAKVLIGGNSSKSVIVETIDKFQSNFFLMIHILTKTINEGHFSGSLWSMAGEFFSNIFNFFIDTMAIGVTSLISLILFVLFIALYLTYQMVIAVAIAVGPVFIPFLILPVTRGLFEGWMKMLIMGGIYLMTSTVIVGLVGTALVSIAAQMGPSTSGVMINYGAYLELVIFEIVGILALLKSHEFAHAIGGSVSIGGMNAGSALVKMGTGAIKGG
ncbi:type IV secretion system protein [Acidithiobacillus thiooxidans]|uniref:type IV secretion system protein n=1 Tax=Acidithiobacillus thiooxidans TaxID=930 RepID=UPI0004E258A0|nr:type IV secretion system protein [Acidithiobacillus thiooxidans]